uniref:Ig-like domain-containing protein n=1 Tax=Macrostomum lignano TaxID=282301 RepID=A0A1I8F454_9PLAT
VRVRICRSGLDQKGAPVAPFGQVTSQLTLTRLRAEYNRAVVRCLATNPVANLSSPDYVLNVLYLPVVTAVPSLAIELGAEVAIECSATGNPEPTVQLENGAGEILSAQPVRHLPLRRRQPLGASNASFAIDIQYGPKVSGPGTVTARSGDQLTIQCSADANPAAPSSSVVWTHLSSGRSKSDVGVTLVIRKVDRSDAGVWRCRFANTLTPSSGPPVQRDGAERLTRQRAVSQFSVDQIRLAIRVSRTDPRLLANVSLSDSGVYFCTPSNAAGHGPTTSISLDVEQAPEWLEPQPARDKNGLGYRVGRLPVPHRKLPEVSRRPNEPPVSSGPRDNGRYLCEASNKRGKISCQDSTCCGIQPLIAGPVETKSPSQRRNIGGLHSALFWPISSLGPPSAGNTPTAHSTGETKSWTSVSSASSNSSNVVNSCE